MSYLPPKRTALGSVGDVADAAVRVVTDPCLPEVARLVLRLHELEQKPAATKPGTTPTPTKPVAGIGLCKAVPAIRGIVWVRERPWVVPLTAAGVVGGLLWLGYAMGKSDRRPR